MAKATVTFEKCIQDSQEYSSDSEHMVSRIFFTLDIDGRQIGLYVDLKQKVGSSFVDGPIEIDIPITAGSMKGEKYRCLLNYEAFSRTVESYYRGLVGSVGAMNGMGGGKARTRNIIFNERRVASFDISGPDSSSLIS
jgi:hypothetical protein